MSKSRFALEAPPLAGGAVDGDTQGGPSSKNSSKSNGSISTTSSNRGLATTAASNEEDLTSTTDGARTGATVVDDRAGGEVVAGGTASAVAMAVGASRPPMLPFRPGAVNSLGNTQGSPSAVPKVPKVATATSDGGPTSEPPPSHTFPNEASFVDKIYETQRRLRAMEDAAKMIQNSQRMRQAKEDVAHRRHVRHLSHQGGGGSSHSTSRSTNASPSAPTAGGGPATTVVASSPMPTTFVENLPLGPNGEAGLYTGHVCVWDTTHKLPHGSGDLTQDGTHFVGTFAAGKMHGLGGWIKTNGDVFIARFVYGVVPPGEEYVYQVSHPGILLCMAQQGHEVKVGGFTLKVVELRQGSIYSHPYIGQVDAAKKLPNGFGVVYFVGGLRYFGEFVNGRFQGYGLLASVGGGVGPLARPGRLYEGQWKDDKRHGQGKQFDAQGNVYQQGKWLDGVFIDEAEALARAPFLPEESVSKENMCPICISVVDEPMEFRSKDPTVWCRHAACKTCVINFIRPKCDTCSQILVTAGSAPRVDVCPDCNKEDRLVCPECRAVIAGVEKAAPAFRNLADAVRGTCQGRVPSSSVTGKACEFSGTPEEHRKHRHDVDHLPVQ